MVVSVPGVGEALNPIGSEIRQRKVAVLNLTQRNHESPANVFSLEHAMQVAGVPYMVTTDVAAACESRLVLITSALHPNTLSAPEKNQLVEYVWDGGVLVAPNIRDVFFYPLFGISGYAQGKFRSQMTWLTANFPAMGRWIDDPNEIVIRLSNPGKYPEGLTTQSYVLNGSKSLAEFDDRGPAVTLYPFGQGQAVALGFSVSDLISRNLFNNDLEAQRIYSNGFEPATDTLIFFLLSLAEQYVPYTVRKHTSPGRSRSTLILTHDIDATSSMNNMLYFARGESLRNIRATYFITTRYFSDFFFKPYYNPETVAIVNRLLDYGQALASHTVGHFLDFNVIGYGAPGNTRENYSPYYNENMQSVGATLYGECEVSKQVLEADTGVSITSFRAGHLVTHKYQTNVLDALGYLYDSSLSANDILTNFPYFMFFDKSINSPISNVIEIPLTISDVYGDEFNELNYEEAVNVWLDVIARNRANSAPAVLLIHPTKLIKYTAQELLLDNLPHDVIVMDMDSYGDFWRRRLVLPFETGLSGQTLTIAFQSPKEEIDPRLSLTIRGGARLEEIQILWNGNPVYYFDLDPWTGDDVIVSNIHVQEFVGVEDWARY